MLLVVTYHYVRHERDSAYPGIHAVHPRDLGSQLDALGARFSFVSPRELLDLVARGAGSRLDRPLCLITFDDGLKEQYERALPVLERAGVPAVFNVNGRCVADGEANPVHLFHWLRSRMPPETFAVKLERACSDLGIAVPARKGFVSADGQNIYDGEDVRYIKHVVNHSLAPDGQVKVAGRLCHDAGLNPRHYARELYMTVPMVTDLWRRGMLGSHGWEHTPKTGLAAEALFRDFSDNQEWFSRVGAGPVPWVSYPYGGRTAVSPAVADCASRAGHRIGFSIERAVNLTAAQPLLFGRLDANDLPGGKHPLLRIERDTIRVIPPATLGRRWFMEESDGG